MEILRKSKTAPALFGRRGFLTGVGATLLQAGLAEHTVSSLPLLKASATTHSNLAWPQVTRLPWHRSMDPVNSKTA